MKLIEAAEKRIVWRGIDYYQKNRVCSCKKTGTYTYDGEVSNEEGSTYLVHIDTKNPKKSTCTCPYAQREEVVVCKHMIALYCKANPDEAETIQAKLQVSSRTGDSIERFKDMLEDMYYLCDCLNIGNPDDRPEWKNMTVRDLLNQELLRMGCYIVMEGQKSAPAAGVMVLNLLLDLDLSAKELEDMDLKNRVEDTYENIPLDIEISVKADAENIILSFFEFFGNTVEAACGVDEKRSDSVVSDYLKKLEKCLSRTAYGSLRKYDSFEDDDEEDEDEENAERDIYDWSNGDDAKEKKGKNTEASGKTLEEWLQELDSLIGLDNIKSEVRTMVNLVRIRKIREERGLGQTQRSLHMVFSGNPGTGKTTVARLIAQIYRTLGVLSHGHLVETDRSGLVAGYVGQTAIKTAEVIKKAMGGVLFIDEAYALTKQGSDNDFGQEAIETLLKSMEDNRGDLVVIVAGYTDLMENFLNSNPGLRSRFSQTLFFEDYDGPQLHEIFRKMCRDSGMQVAKDADEAMRVYFYELYENRGENFANARDVRNAFEKILARQANRLAEVHDRDLTDEMLMEILPEDVAIAEKDIE